MYFLLLPVIYHGIYIIYSNVIVMVCVNDTIYIHHGETNNRDIRNVFLVGGAITILKNMKVNGKDYPIYYGK